MDVLQVVHALPAATYGGTELYTTWLAEALAEEHEVTVATPRGADTDVEGATVHELPDPADWVDESGMDSGLECGVVHWSVDEAFASLLETVEPDVVHFQHLKYLSATLPEICRERSIPSVLTLHDYWTMCHRGQLHRPDAVHCSGPESVAKCTACFGEALRRTVAGESPYEDGVVETEGEDDPPSAFDPPTGGGEPNPDRRDRADVARRTEALAAARAETDLLVAPSRFLRRQFLAYGTPEDRIVHRRNGIRTAAYRDTGFDPDGGLVLGYAGRISPEKGLHVLLAALEDVSGDVELAVFGRFDPDGDDYHARLQSAADDRVRFHGFYEDNATPAATADVLVVPSLWYENSPLVIQEAFASRVPVVAGDVGGMAELVTDGRDGLTVPPGDAGALAGTIQRLADDPGLVGELRRGIEPPKDVAEHADELVALYEAVVDGTRRTWPERPGQPS